MAVNLLRTFFVSPVATEMARSKSQSPISPKNPSSTLSRDVTSVSRS